MKKVSRNFLWLTLLNKRLLKKISFLVILCSIPFLVIGVNYMASLESGMLKVVLCQEEAEDDLYVSIKDKLYEHGNMLQFIEAEDSKEAELLVRSGQADVAWIFPKDLQGQIETFLSNDFNEEGLIKVLEKEDNVALRMSREILFGELYANISYSLYTQYVTEKLLLEESITDEQLREHYENTNMEGSMFVFSYLDGTEGDITTSYLLFPVRGLLAVVIALCGLAISMYFMQDEEKGVFTWMPLNKSVWGSWLYQLPGLVDVCTIVLIALFFADIFTNWLTELVLMAMYLLMVAGFSDVVRRLCGKPIRLGAIIPMLILVMLALSPIFMGAFDAKPIQILLPSYYYLNAIHNRYYWIWMLVYIVVVFVLDSVLLRFQSRKRLK